MRADISRVHGDRRHAGGRCGATSLWLRTSVAIVTLALGMLVVSLASEAQPPKTMPRIGFLSVTSPAAVSVRIEAFRQGLRALGYEEGKNMVIEWRYAEGKLNRLPALAAELVRLKVDVIVTAGPPPTRAAKAATNTIPIVMGFDNDPVSSEFVTSLAQPGGNITGLSTLHPEISGKRLELLMTTIPTLSRVAVLWDSATPGNAQAFRETELAAGALGVQLQDLEVQGVKDIETLFRAASKGRADAALVLSSHLLFAQRTQVTDLAVKSRLPTIYDAAEFVADGGLMAYGPDYTDLFRRAATYVDKLLKGTKPADLPVEQPTKFELVINLKTAKELDLTIPPMLLFQADKVIK